MKNLEKIGKKISIGLLTAAAAGRTSAAYLTFCFFRC